VPELQRRSPIAGDFPEGRGAGRPDDLDVVIAERRGLSLVQVTARRGQEQAVAARLGLDPTPGQASELQAGRALWLAPGTWMVVAEALDDGALYQSLRAHLQDVAAVVDQSHGRTVLRLAGRRARDVLAKGCRLDLHPRVFRPGMCAQTVIAQVAVLLDQGDERPTYDLYLFPGYALDFLEWLTSSAAEFERRPVPSQPISTLPGLPSP
jgi:heterotetrameric sarcosine oxidase gamma subunit